MSEPTPAKRLRGLEPAAQELNKRMILTQDLMNVFFKGSSQGQRGTLANIKDMFDHRNVKSDVGDCFNHVADFIKFITTGYIILAAMQLLNIHSIDDTPEGIDITGWDEHKQLQWFSDFCDTLVNLVWQDIEPEAVINAEDKGGPMIECDGAACPNQWYHLECVHMDDDDVPDAEWYCSTSCTPDDTYKYCTCQTLIPGSIMVGCDNDLCPRGSCFHLPCVSLRDIPDGNWYCCDTCRTTGPSGPVPQEDEYMFNYISSLTWHGLMDMTRRDAIRKNDGPFIITTWHHDLVPFHNKHHVKYVILAHRLLAAVGGWLPRRLGQDLIWNRTVNLTGGKGRNLEMDLVNEFLNKEFKESLKDSRGKLTEETVSRHSQMIGGLSREINAIYETEPESKAYSSLAPKDKIYKQDLLTFVRLLEKDHFFGREFPAFPQFRFQASASDPKRLKDKLSKLSERLDSNRRKMGPVF